MANRNLSLVTNNVNRIKVGLGGRSTHSLFANAPQVVTIREPTLSACLPKQAEGLFAARTNEELVAETGKLLAEIELDTFVIATYVKDDDDPAEVPSALVMGQCPLDWIERYNQKGYIDVDTRLASSLTQASPYLWDRTQFNGHEAEELFEEAASYGIRAGISTALLNHEGYLGMFSASTSLNIGVSDLLTPIIRGRFLIVKDYLAELLSPGNRTVVSEANELPDDELVDLSPRQREILYWTASGYAPTKIADKLHISDSTVRAHLATIKTRLRVRKLGHAVARALKLRIIPFPD